jgi:phosphoglycolate phosphatase
MSGPRRLVIFDVDGTLIDSQDHIHAAMAHAFAAVGEALPPRKVVLSIVGLSLHQAVARLVPDLAEAVRAEIVEAYKRSFGQLRGQSLSVLYPGALAALDHLRNDGAVVLGLATGKSRRGLDHVLAGHGLDGYFATEQVADDHPSKPHPSMILRALADTGIDAQDAVMIGDTSFDIEMGCAAGVHTIGVCWGYHPPEALLGAGAGQLVSEYIGLIPALEKIWRQG